MNTDGTDRAAADERQPARLPALDLGRRVADRVDQLRARTRVRPPDDPGCVIYGDRDIWLMNSDGSNKQLLFDGFGEDQYPEWTPDGQDRRHGRRDR